MFKLKARMKYLKGVRHTREYSNGGKEDRGTLLLQRHCSNGDVTTVRVEETAALALVHVHLVCDFCFVALGVVTFLGPLWVLVVNPNVLRTR